jgi:putative ABC transport system substrate-binding protein
MRRREFITLLGGAAAALPIAASAHAQQPDRMQRIGMLIGSAEDDPEMKSRLASFRRGLERRGWSEGRNVRIDTRFAEGSAERYGPLAKELVALRPDVIFAHTTPVAEALQQESRTIPIVFVTVSDLSDQASFPAWRVLGVILPVCCSSRRASLANGWPCSRRSLLN